MANKTGNRHAEAQQIRQDVIQKWDGILPFYEAFYLHAIDYAATAALKAIDRFEAEIQTFLEFENYVDATNQEEVVSAVHEALTHCAGLSKIFWTPAKGALGPKRSEKLRRAYELDETSPLNNRSLRNTLEHFDEKLDEFLLSMPVGPMFPGSMVRPHTLADEPIGKIFRLVDPEAMIFVIFNKKYEFADIFDEAHRVAERTAELLGSGSRLDIPNQKPADQGV